MNRQQRRQAMREERSRTKSYPIRLTLLEGWEEVAHITPTPDQVWLSREFLVQVFHETVLDYPSLVRRLSICRTERTADLQAWKDGISWDELQAIKRDVGFGDWYAIEIFPRDVDMINVANMRHLWVLEYPLEFGWFPSRKDKR